MREYFHDWRRKTGAAALVMACALMVLWKRSFQDLDELALFGGHIHSNGGMIILWYMHGRQIPSSEAVVWEARTAWQMPHWYIAGTLTLLSAWLLLKKPRTKPNQTDDSK